MAVTTEISITDTIKENRWSAEFFDPKYSFEPTDRYKWSRIGNLLKRCQYGISISMNENHNGYPIFRMNEIENCFLTEAAKCAAISKTEFSAFKLYYNDILFNRTNSFDFVGRTGILKEDTDSVFASYLIRVNPNEQYILPEFLVIYLNTPFGIGQIKRRAMHSINQANVSASELKRILIPLIDIHLQQEIRDVVNEAFKLNKASESLYIQAEQLLEQELGLDQIQKDNRITNEVRLSEAVSSHRLDAQCFKPEYIQYELVLRNMKNFVSLREVILTFSKGQQQTVSDKGNIDYVSIKDVSRGEVIASSKCHSTSNLVAADKEDLLLAITGATIGKIGMNFRLNKLAFCGDLLALKTRDTINPYYLLRILDSDIAQTQFQRWITGSTNGHLSPTDVAKVIVPRLNSAKEEKIAEMVQQSFINKRVSEKLLSQAKNRVEELIEQGVN